MFPLAPAEAEPIALIDTVKSPSAKLAKVSFVPAEI